MGNLRDHKDKIYNSWTVLEYVGLKGRDAVWKCRCRCGLEKDQKICNIVNGASRQCLNCAKISKDYNEVVPITHWNKITNRAARKGYEFNLDKEYATNLYLSQDKKCALTDLDISFARNGNEDRNGLQTASLDRIDSSVGYIEGNVQLVHKDVNRMKNIFNEDYFISICKAVANKKTYKAVDHHKFDR